MKKKILMSLFTIAIVGTLITGGAIAYFNDTEEVGQNVFTAGTLDLEIGGNPVSFTIDNMKPDGVATAFYCYLTNAGTIDGVVSVEFSSITNYENGRNGPELAAGDTTPNVGELGYELRAELIGAGTTITVNSSYGSNTGWHPFMGYGEGQSFVLFTLGPSETASFIMKVILPSSVGNIVQSDSVEFNLIFTLEQAP